MMTNNNSFRRSRAAFALRHSRLKPSFRFNRLEPNWSRRRSMQISFYHETSPVKTPFSRLHARAPRSDPDRGQRLAAQKHEELEHAASFQIAASPTANLSSKPHAPATTPSKQSRRPKFIISRRVSQKTMGVGYLQKCRCSFGDLSRWLAPFVLANAWTFSTPLEAFSRSDSDGSKDRFCKLSDTRIDHTQ